MNNKELLTWTISKYPVNNTDYKNMLIENILEFQTRNQFTMEELQKKSIKTLEIIHDNVE